MKRPRAAKQNQKHSDHKRQRIARKQQPHIIFKLAIHIAPVARKKYDRKYRNTDLMKRVLQHIQSKTGRMGNSILSQIDDARDPGSASQRCHPVKGAEKRISHALFIWKFRSVFSCKHRCDLAFYQMIEYRHHTNARDDPRCRLFQLFQYGSRLIPECIHDHSDDQKHKSPLYDLFLSLTDDKNRLLFLFKVRITVPVIRMLRPELIGSFFPLTGIFHTFSTKVLYRLRLLNIC